MAHTSPIAAVVFDLDGVLVDGESLHFAAARDQLAEYGVRLDRGMYQQFIGRTIENGWDLVSRLYDPPVTRDEYVRAYGQRVLTQYRARAVPMPGARALLERLREAEIPRALASSSLRAWIDAALTALGLQDVFTVTVAGDEIRRGKPDPEIYRTTAQRLGVAPPACLAIEDAPAGIAAALAVGMRVVAVRTEMTAGLSLARPERVIDSLSEFDLGWLKAREVEASGV